MKKLHIITPVKDNVPSALETARAILSSRLDAPHTYTIYNDFSTDESTRQLDEASQELGFRLVNLSDLTTHPSPNYLLVLQREQKLCLEEDAALLIVESDVVVRPETLQGLWKAAQEHADAGIVASVTVDDDGVINYPYLYAKGKENQVLDTRRHCSFCCSLLTPELLRRVDFEQLMLVVIATQPLAVVHNSAGEIGADARHPLQHARVGRVHLDALCRFYLHGIPHCVALYHSLTLYERCCRQVVVADTNVWFQLAILFARQSVQTGKVQRATVNTTCSSIFINIPYLPFLQSQSQQHCAVGRIRVEGH